MIVSINPSEFDRTGTIETDSSTKTKETGASWGNTYTNVRSKELSPLFSRFGEEIRNNQGVSFEKRSWLIRKENRVILSRKMAYNVDGNRHHITAVRDYKGARDLIVLDTEYRDN